MTARSNESLKHVLWTALPSEAPGLSASEVWDAIKDRDRWRRNSVYQMICQLGREGYVCRSNSVPQRAWRGKPIGEYIDPFWPPALEQRLAELWATGATESAIGKRLGKTKAAVGQKARRLKLPGRGSPILPPNNEPSVRSVRGREGGGALAPMHQTSWAALLENTPCLRGGN